MPQFRSKDLQERKILIFSQKKLPFLLGNACCPESILNAGF
jgi:hypothetical protein